MDLGGIGTRERSLQIIRYAGFIVPVLLTLYGFLIRSHLVPYEFYKSDLIFYTLMSTWVVVGGWQLVFIIKTMRQAYIRLGLYHIFAFIYFTSIAGFSMPLTTTWSLLVLAMFAFFSYRGVVFSIIFLCLTAAADIYLHSDIPGVLIADIGTLLAIIVVSISIVFLTHVQETDSAELERSKSQEELQRDSILTLVNNLADSVISTDEHGVVRIFNAASLNLLDTNDSLIGKHIDEIITLRNQNDATVSLFSYLKKSRSVSVMDDLRTAIGDDVVRLEITYSPIRGSYSKSKQTEPQDGYIIIMRDVTKMKSLEEERDEFISVVSHELRTPITIAEGTISNAQLIFDRDDIHDELLKQGLEQAHEQVIYLAKMVNDLSTLSRAERGVADDPEEIDVKELATRLWNSYSPEAEEKGLHLNLDIKGKLGYVMVSRLYLHELLQNFITNAIKYTKKGSVTLSVVKQNNKLLFTVKDTGIGISKSDQSKIFNKFYRSEDYRTRETGGTGLGLYVALKLAKKIGCKIKLESRINHGSSFSFTLPIKKD